MRESPPVGREELYGTRGEYGRLSLIGEGMVVDVVSCDLLR